MIQRVTHCLLVAAAIMIISVYTHLNGTNAYAQQSLNLLRIKPIGIDADYFTLTLNPGESRELSVELANVGLTAARARTYAADVYTIVNGGMGAELDGDVSSGATLWLDYAANTIELAPKTGLQRTFTVKVPVNITPGEYITSLAIQNADAAVSNQSGDIAIKQITRQVIAIAITIPGARNPGLEIGGVSYRTVASQSYVAVGVKNIGNVLLKPSGEFVLTGIDGVEVSRYPVTMDSIYAGTETFVEVPFAGRLNPGDYSVMLSLADPTAQIQVTSPATLLNVPEALLEGPPQPIGAVPVPASITQSPMAYANEWILWLIPGVLLVGVIVIAKLVRSVQFAADLHKDNTQNRM